MKSLSQKSELGKFETEVKMNSKLNGTKFLLYYSKWYNMMQRFKVFGYSV